MFSSSDSDSSWTEDLKEDMEKIAELKRISQDTEHLFDLKEREKALARTLRRSQRLADLYSADLPGNLGTDLGIEEVAGDLNPLYSAEASPYRTPCLTCHSPTHIAKH